MYICLSGNKSMLYKHKKHNRGVNSVWGNKKSLTYFLNWIDTECRAMDVPMQVKNTTRYQERAHTALGGWEGRRRGCWWPECPLESTRKRGCPALCCRQGGFRHRFGAAIRLKTIEGLHLGTGFENAGLLLLTTDAELTRSFQAPR